MALTIYTVSDPAVVGSVMTSMAMFFGQDSWVGTAIKLAMLISLIFILAKGVLARDGLRLDILLLQFIVISVAFIPKTTVVIEQFDNNAPPRVVDDVPYAIAIPGTLAGAFALFMTQKIETVMSSVDGRYIAPSGNLDPFMPAKVLMRIAATPFAPSTYMDENFSQTLFLASKNCAGPGLASANFDKSAKGLHLFSENLIGDGAATVKYSADFPYYSGGGSGELVTCAEIKSYIDNIQTQLESNDASVFDKAIDGIAKTTDVRRYSEFGGASPSTRDLNDLISDINRVAPASANFNAAALANVMSYTVLKQTARSGANPIDKVIEVQRDAGLFNWAKSESAQSMLVTSTAPKFMDILFFIFIASTPIVMFVVAANPSGGLKVAGAYVLFGLWTQSWIPMMAIISGWYQAEIKNFAGPGVDGLSPEYLSALMQHVNASTIAASNMLQSAPYLMFAIMSGSMFALSNLVSKAAPSGDVSGMSGNGGGSGSSSNPLGGDLASSKTNPMAQRQQIAQGHAMATGAMNFSQASPGGDAGAAIGGLPSVDLGGGVATSAAAATQRSASARSQLTKQAQQSIGDIAALSRSGGTSMSGSQMVSWLQTQGFDASWNAGQQVATVNGKTYQFSQGTSTSSEVLFGGRAGVQAGTPGTAPVTLNQDENTGEGKDGKNGVKRNIPVPQASVGLGTELRKKDGNTAAVENKETQGTTAQHNTGNGAATSSGQQGGSGYSGNKAENHSDTGARTKQAMDQISRAAAQIKALDQADKLTQQATADGSAKVGSKIDGADLVNRYGRKFEGADSASSGAAKARLEQVLGGATAGETGQRIMAKMADYQNQMKMERSSLSNDQIAAAAFLKAAQDVAASGNAQQKMEAMTAMAKLAEKSGYYGASNGMANVKDANQIIDRVEGSLKNMEGEVKPEAQAAADKANQVPGQVSSIQGQAEGKIASGQSGAAATYAKADELQSQVEDKGRDVVGGYAEQAGNAAAKNADTQKLNENLSSAKRDRNVIPSTDYESVRRSLMNADERLNDTGNKIRFEQESRARQEAGAASIDNYLGQGGKFTANEPHELMYQNAMAKGDQALADRVKEIAKGNGVDASNWDGNFKAAAGDQNLNNGWSPAKDEEPKNNSHAGTPLKNFAANVGEAVDHLKEQVGGVNPPSQTQSNAGPAAVQESASNFSAGVDNASERLHAQTASNAGPAVQESPSNAPPIAGPSSNTYSDTPAHNSGDASGGPGSSASSPTVTVEQVTNVASSGGDGGQGGGGLPSLGDVQGVDLTRNSEGGAPPPAPGASNPSNSSKPNASSPQGSAGKPPEKQVPGR